MALRIYFRALRLVPGNWVLAGVFLLATLLVVYNLSGYPEFTALDEAYRLMLPRNLAMEGEWGISTYEGLSPFWHDSTGPTVLLPIAVIFKIFGVTLGNARIVISIYTILASIAVYVYTREAYGHRAAVVAILTFLFWGPPWLNTIVMGRSVYGEVPGLAFLFWGSYFWGRSVRLNRRKDWMLASLFFSCAVLTKNLLFLAIAASFMGLFIIDRLWLKTLRWHQTTLPMLSCLFAFIGWSILQSILNGTSSGAVVNPTIAGFLLFVQQPSQLITLWYKNLKFLAEQDILLWGAPALFYSIASAFHQEDRRATIGLLFIPFFLVSWFIWYVFISIGWPRYAYPEWAVMSVLVAKFLVDLADGAPRNLSICDGVFSAIEKRNHKALSLAAWLLILMLLFWPAQNTVRRLISGDNHGAQKFAAYLDAHLSFDVRILSGEWDVSFFSNHQFVPIPFGFLIGKVDCEQLGLHCNDNPIRKFADLRPDYIVDGPENEHLQYVPSELLERNCKCVVSIEEYSLYDTRDRCYLKN